MPNDNIVLRFNKVSFDYGPNHSILEEASFSLRWGAKFALMGQNGAGKSTIFNLISGALAPEEGTISIDGKLTIAVSRQVIPADQMKLTVREFFQNCFKHKVYDIEK